MMFAIIIFLCCTPVSVADTLLDRAFALVEQDVQACRQEMRGTLDWIVETLSELKNKVDTVTDATSEIKNKVDTLTDATSEIKNRVGTLETTVTDATSEIKDKVETTVQLGTTIKTRQQAWLSEVRLISLFKLTGENNPTSSNSYNPGLAVDGQYVFSKKHESEMRTYSTTRRGTNNKIWIDLGGLFRVYSVRVWNTRHSDTSDFVGTEVYVGEGTQSSELIGTASGVHYFYDFTLPDTTVKYGSRVTLLQPRSTWITVLEVQVWGNGPYDSSDKFN